MNADPARDAVYHAGERAVQDRAGAAEAATAAIGAIHAQIPPPAATFLTEREFLVVAARDTDGRVWTTQLTGKPGFMQAPNEHTVLVDALPGDHDPLATTLTGNALVGAIAIDFATRRRMRINGESSGDAQGLILKPDQVYANCPKFIAMRTVETTAGAIAPRAFQAERLDEHTRTIIANAETFFIGSAHPERGADASHRGGLAGFVSMLDDRTLWWPDYKGNAMFMTLGNIVEVPQAGLLFVDWERGDTLQITGEATIDWNPAIAQRFPGAQRMVKFAIERVVMTTDASPLRYSKAVPSRVSPPLAKRTLASL